MIPALAALAASAALAAGFSPLERDEPHVEEGNARLEAGDPAGALQRYDEAERAVGSRAEIDHDRGNALSAAGRAEEAKAAWRRAAARAPAELASRALQNLGTALAAEGDRDGAARAFADALTKDPSNEDARFDLEVLLRGGGPPPRSAPAPSPPPPAAAAPGAEEPDDGAKARGDRADPPPGDAGEGEREEPPRAGSREPEPEPGGDADAREAEVGGEGHGERPRGALTRQEAEKLLDALRARERNMPFSPGERRRGGRRGDAGKDW